jgi:hypothetical protein
MVERGIDIADTKVQFFSEIPKLMGVCHLVMTLDFDSRKVGPIPTPSASINRIYIPGVNGSITVSKTAGQGSNPWGCAKFTVLVV